MKTLQNNFTTPNQSKRLLELGVPADSADCSIDKFGRVHKIPQDNWNLLFSQLKQQTIYTIHPCWSVGRLMEIITICHLSRDNRFCFKKDMCESLVETICGFIKYGEMDFSKLEE